MSNISFYDKGIFKKHCMSYIYFCYHCVLDKHHMVSFYLSDGDTSLNRLHEKCVDDFVLRTFSCVALFMIANLFRLKCMHGS